ncbi:MAG: class I adenylate-forming enzyme family protein [Halorientalis sp.]
MGSEWPTRDPLAHRTATTPDRTAVVAAETGAADTYRAFDERVTDRAAALTALAGEAPTVALLLDTRVAFADLLFATLRAGGRLVPLNTRLTEGELTERAARVAPDLLVCGEETAATARAVTDGPVASVDAPSRDGVASLADYGDPGSVDPATVGPDTEWLVVFTSGTTGRPKGVRLTVGNLLSSATASAFRLGVAPDDRWLCCLPAYHVGGLAPLVRSTLYGTTAVVQRGFDAERTAATLDEHDVTGVSLVPTALRRLLDAGWEPGAALRFVLLGGAPAPASLLDRCAERGVPVHPTYGLTEAASQVATARPREAFSHEGTVGQPLVTTEVTVVDEDGNALDPGERGELVVAGPTVTPGYLDDERTAAAFSGRGLHTGDVGYRDEDGRLWVCNRLDDRIVTGGENVDPGEVAAVVRDHPGVAEAAVLGVPDEEWGERVAALVVPAGDADLSPDAVAAHCRERLAGFKCPKTVTLAEALPRTASGTVDREAARRLLEGSP